VTPVASRQVTETASFIGRVTAIDKVDIVARVTGFIEERYFTEGQHGGEALWAAATPQRAMTLSAAIASRQPRELLRLSIKVPSRLISMPTIALPTVEDHFGITPKY
jgi:hypothetical protein